MTDFDADELWKEFRGSEPSATDCLPSLAREARNPLASGLISDDSDVSSRSDIQRLPGGASQSNSLPSLASEARNPLATGLITDDSERPSRSDVPQYIHHPPGETSRSNPRGIKSSVQPRPSNARIEPTRFVVPREVIPLDPFAQDLNRLDDILQSLDADVRLRFRFHAPDPP